MIFKRRATFKNDPEIFQYFSSEKRLECSFVIVKICYLEMTQIYVYQLRDPPLANENVEKQKPNEKTDDYTSCDKEASDTDLPQYLPSLPKSILTVVNNERQVNPISIFFLFYEHCIDNFLRRHEDALDSIREHEVFLNFLQISFLSNFYDFKHWSNSHALTTVQV